MLTTENEIEETQAENAETENAETENAETENVDTSPKPAADPQSSDQEYTSSPTSSSKGLAFKSVRLDEDPENKGLPCLDLGTKPVSIFEFWPSWFFYVPVTTYWILLGFRYRNFALPLVVNPNIPLGGMLEESKLDILDSAGDIARPYILPYTVCAQSEVLTEESDQADWEGFAENTLHNAANTGVHLPFVAKPEFGCRGTGVQRVRNLNEFVKYLRGFPVGERFILQALAPYSAEAGVFYERFPGSAEGKVTSITLKYRPYVIGDGASTLKSLILKDARASILRERYFALNAHRLTEVPAKDEVVALVFAGSHCKGSIFRNGNEYITQALSKKIDGIMQDFPDFHYGRLDVKFNNIDDLQKGENFCIIEVNGVSSEKTHIWDSRTTLREAFATLFEQYGTLYKMGNEMRRLGKRPPSAKKLIRAWIDMLRDKTEYPETT